MIDRIVSIVAVAQAIFVTLQAGVKLMEQHCVPTSPGVEMEGPRILPTTNEALFDLTEAFRHAVQLGLRCGKYQDPKSFEMGFRAKPEPYRLSLTGIVEERQDQSSVKIGNVEAFLKNRRDQLVSAFESITHASHQHNDFDVIHSTHVSLHDDSQSSSSTIAKAFAPETFASLRRSYGIAESLFQEKLLESGAFVSFQANSKGSARSGGVFFFTSDGMFLIKSIKKVEAATLLDILPGYHAYMVKHGRKSLINRICGMYSVEMAPPSAPSKSEEYVFVVMNSVFPADVRLAKRFDLKGSTLGRKASASESVAKDLDLIQQSKEPGGGLTISEGAKHLLMKQLREDVELLRSCSLIDYSLLVGVAPLPQDGSNQSRIRRLVKRLRAMVFAKLSGRSGKKNSGELAIVHGDCNGIPAMYYLGLIDFLQPFNTRKYAEYQLKALIYNRRTFSCIPPTVYADRFLRFMDRHIKGS